MVLTLQDSDKESGFLVCNVGGASRIFGLRGGVLTNEIVWPYYLSMATQMIKTTYSLDVDTVRALERMARRWGVSKSEALRRAIRSAAAQVGTEEGGPLQALDQLQRSVGLSDAKANDWVRVARTTRRSSSTRRELPG